MARMQTDLPPTVTPLRPVEDRALGSAESRLCRTLRQECEAMFQHALDEAKELPAELIERLARVLVPSGGTAANDAAQFEALTVAHGELSVLVAPARGRTLVLLQQEREAHPHLYVFGPVRLVRQMLGFAVFALLSTSALSTFSNVNVANVAKGWFSLSGIDAVCVLAFLLSVAGLGAAFSNLSTINRYIENANYDPTFEGSYWVRVVLGLISGVVLGEILFDLLVKDGVGGASDLAPAGERIVLAFLGGFATAPVQSLLTNLSDAIGTLLQGRNAPPQRPQRSLPAPAPVPAKAID